MEFNRMDRDDYFHPAYEEERAMSEVTITRLADGLGYGEGTISTAERTDVTAEDIAAGEAIIESELVLVDVDRDKNGEPIDDDGCGDGRGVKEIWEGLTQRFKSLHRAKVFGAGVAMAASDEIGSGHAKGKSVKSVFLGAIDTLKAHGLNFGGHTDDHAHGEKCGCGAIDKAPEVVENAVRFQAQIAESIQTLGVDDTGLDEIFDHYAAFVDAQPADEPYSGAEVMSAIQGDGRVTKRLEGDHKEFFIVLNMVSGKTVDQEAIRAATGGKLQTFAVDVWRLQEIAQKLHPEDAQAQQQALLSKLVYTLAVGATLTRGDLPVYVINTADALVAA